MNLDRKGTKKWIAKYHVAYDFFGSYSSGLQYLEWFYFFPIFVLQYFKTIYIGIYLFYKL